MHANAVSMSILPIHCMLYCIVPTVQELHALTVVRCLHCIDLSRMRVCPAVPHFLTRAVAGTVGGWTWQHEVPAQMQQSKAWFRSRLSAQIAKLYLAGVWICNPSIFYFGVCLAFSWCSINLLANYSLKRQRFWSEIIEVFTIAKQVILRGTIRYAAIGRQEV